MDLIPTRKPSTVYTVVDVACYLLALVALGLFLIWGARK